MLEFQLGFVICEFCGCLCVCSCICVFVMMFVVVVFMLSMVTFWCLESLGLCVMCGCAVRIGGVLMLFLVFIMLFLLLLLLLLVVVVMVLSMVNFWR